VDACARKVPEGSYKVWVGASSREIRLAAEVKVRGSRGEAQNVPEWYRDPKGKVSQEDFESLLGRKIEPIDPRRRGEYTLDCTFNDMKDSFIIKQVIKSIEKTIAKGFGGMDYSNPTFKMIMASSTGTPLKNLSQLSPDSMPKHITQGLVHLANGKCIQAILAFSQKTKEKK
jgi:beta-glucosidase